MELYGYLDYNTNNKNSNSNFNINQLLKQQIGLKNKLLILKENSENNNNINTLKNEIRNRCSVKSKEINIK